MNGPSQRSSDHREKPRLPSAWKAFPPAWKISIPAASCRASIAEQEGGSNRPPGRLFVLLLGLFLLIHVVPATAEQTCPTVDRGRLLQDHPEQLLDCRNGSPTDRVWAAHALAQSG